MTFPRFGNKSIPTFDNAVPLVKSASARVTKKETAITIIEPEKPNSTMTKEQQPQQPQGGTQSYFMNMPTGPGMMPTGPMMVLMPPNCGPIPPNFYNCNTACNGDSVGGGTRSIDYYGCYGDNGDSPTINTSYSGTETSYDSRDDTPCADSKQMCLEAGQMVHLTFNALAEGVTSVLNYSENMCSRCSTGMEGDSTGAAANSSRRGRSGGRDGASAPDVGLNGVVSDGCALSLAADGLNNLAGALDQGLTYGENLIDPPSNQVKNGNGESHPTSKDAIAAPGAATTTLDPISEKMDELLKILKHKESLVDNKNEVEEVLKAKKDPDGSRPNDDPIEMNKKSVDPPVNSSVNLNGLNESAITKASEIFTVTNDLVLDVDHVSAANNNSMEVTVDSKGKDSMMTSEKSSVLGDIMAVTMTRAQKKKNKKAADASIDSKSSKRRGLKQVLKDMKNVVPKEIKSAKNVKKAAPNKDAKNNSKPRDNAASNNKVNIENDGSTHPANNDAIAACAIAPKKVNELTKIFEEKDFLASAAESTENAEAKKKDHGSVAVAPTFTITEKTNKIVNPVVVKDLNCLNESAITKDSQMMNVINNDLVLDADDVGAANNRSMEVTVDSKKAKDDSVSTQKLSIEPMAAEPNATQKGGEKASGRKPPVSHMAVTTPNVTIDSKSSITTKDDTPKTQGGKQKSRNRGLKQVLKDMKNVVPREIKSTKKSPTATKNISKPLAAPVKTTVDSPKVKAKAEKQAVVNVSVDSMGFPSSNVKKASPKVFKTRTAVTKTTLEPPKKATAEKRPVAAVTVDSMGFPSSSQSKDKGAWEGSSDSFFNDNACASGQDVGGFSSNSPAVVVMNNTTTTSESETRICAWCRKGGNDAPEIVEKLKLCSSCQATYYCSRECQSKDWINGHAKTCVPATTSITTAM